MNIGNTKRIEKDEREKEGDRQKKKDISNEVTS